MNKSNFIRTGGYPLKAERLQEMQTAYQTLNAFGALAGNLTIISGCETPHGSAIVKDGFVYIDNELLEFRESVVNEDSKVIIIEEVVNKAFKNGSIKQVYTIRYAAFGTSEASWPWSSFTRPIQTKNIEGLINGLTNRLTIVEDKLVGIETKLNGIEDGAQKNVQSDWDVTDSNLDTFIKNKFKSVAFLHGDSKKIGNVTSNSYSIVISIPDVGTSNYQVVGSIRSNSTNFNLDNNIFHNTREHTATSFRLCLREMSNDDQNISFDYFLVKK